jgi:peptide deformylase
VPARLDAVAVRDGLSIDVEVGGLDAQAAQHVAERLRGLVHVERVLMSTRIFAEEARA